MRIAVLALSLALAPSAWAATIDGPNTLGCRDIEVHRRIGRAAGARDRQGIEAIVNAAMRSGVCSPLPVGLKVRIEENSFPYACVTKFGTAGPCLWIMQREVDVKE
jgi:hypothetical protein